MRRDLVWVREEFFVSPSWAVFCRRRGRLNGRFFQLVKAEAAAGWDKRLDPFRAVDIPRILWMYWDGGEEKAPVLVRSCIDNWRERNPGWDVRVLDRQAAEQLVDFSVLSGKAVSSQFYANVLRLELLAEYGGVWADATTLCHRPLDEWLPPLATQGFFAFVDGGPGRALESWFIASEPRGAIVTGWRNSYVGELGKIAVKPRHYFFMEYAFEWAVRTDHTLADAWQRCARVPASPCLVAASALQGRNEWSAAVDLIRKGLPLSKLTWKAQISLEDVRRLVVDAQPQADP